MRTVSQPRRKLTKKQMGFARDYLETGNGTLAVRNNYDVINDHSAAVIASENLIKPDIRAYLESKAQRASEIIFELAENATNETVRLSASKDIMDRSGFKPVEKTANLNVNVDGGAGDNVLELAAKAADLLKQQKL